jgi:hypothetical protein
LGKITWPATALIIPLPYPTVLGLETVIISHGKSMKTRIMYIECKGNEISGPARIGRVTFSKSGKSLYYQGRTFHTLSGRGFKANYLDWECGEQYWISGCKKRGGDRLYSGTIEIDDDVREEYWSEIRHLPDRKGQKLIRCVGKHR